MAINFSGFHEYQNQNTAGTSSPAQGVQAATAGGTAGSSQAGQLTAGQVFSGEVVSVEGKEIQLLLDNNQTLNAKLDSGLSVAVGQILSFEVKSTSNSQTSLRPLYANLTQNPSILNALKGANMPVTDTNISMVSSMMEEGMPVNKQALWSMAKAVNDNPFASPATLVQLTKLGLPIDELTIRQLENYKSFEHQIVRDAANLAEGLAKLPAEVLQSENPSQGLQLAGQVLQMLGTGEEGTIGNKLAESLLLKGTEILEEQAQGKTLIQSGVDAKTTAAETSSGEALPSADPAVLSKGPSSSAQQSFFAGQLAALGLSEAEQGRLLSGETDAMELFSFVKTLLAAQNGNAAHPLNADQQQILQTLLGSGEFEAAVKEGLLKQFLLKPEEVAGEGKIEELYKRIAEQSAKAIELLQNVGKDGGAVMKSAQNLGDNVNFMNQLNHMMAYVQLPLRMNRENAHGELYVYTKRKNLAAKGTNVSALLHLEMEHLGTMDVYVAMQNSKVSTHFYMENEETLDFIEQHIHMLDERLTKKGYQMNTTVTVKAEAEPKSIVKEFLKNDGVTAAPVVSKLSFDVRA